MFYIVNKDKICSYLVVVSVIGVLLVLGTMIPKETIQTSKTQNEQEMSYQNNINVINEIEE